MFEGWIKWCDYRGYPWKIKDNYFYWQTNYQTGRVDNNRNCDWLSWEIFTQL